MAVTKFNGVLNLDLTLKAEMKSFKNDEGKDVDYVSYFIEIPGIGGEILKVNVSFAANDKKLVKYLLENYINNALDKNAAAKQFFGE